MRKSKSINNYITVLQLIGKGGYMIQNTELKVGKKETKIPSQLFPFKKNDHIIPVKIN